MSNVFILVERIRENARQIGYQARLTGVFVPNPYMLDLPYHNHWNDGYDLGVFDANQELDIRSEETFLIEDFSD